MDVYPQVLQYLENGRKVLFSGTACQIAGLKKYLNNDKMITDIFDMHVVNTIGCFIDRFGTQVSSSERNEILGEKKVPLN